MADLTEVSKLLQEVLHGYEHIGPTSEHWSNILTLPQGVSWELTGFYYKLYYTDEIQPHCKHCSCPRHREPKNLSENYKHFFPKTVDSYAHILDAWDKFYRRSFDPITQEPSVRTKTDIVRNYRGEAYVTLTATDNESAQEHFIRVRAEYITSKPIFPKTYRKREKYNANAFNQRRRPFCHTCARDTCELLHPAHRNKQ